MPNNSKLSGSDAKSSDAVLESHGVLESDSSPFLGLGLELGLEVSGLGLELGALYTYIMLSHITSCTETACLRKFSGLVSTRYLFSVSVSVFTAEYCKYTQWLCQGYTCHWLPATQPFSEASRFNYS